jgi:serine phosphatase RsbU (regulator of sigma subunit)
MEIGNTAFYLEKIRLLQEKLEATESILRKYVTKQKELESQLQQKNEELEQQNSEILAQNEELHQSQEELKAQKEFLDKQNETLTKTNEKLNSHEQILKKALEKIKVSEQEIKAKNQELEQKQAEILAQNEELIQSQEELRAQREFIDKQNEELVKKNEKLGLNEQILKKALEKIKASEQEIKAKNQELEQKQVEILTQNEELKQIKEELLSKWEFIQKQNETLRMQHDKLNSSIRAAQNIQRAILPSDEFLRRVFAEYFILYEPKDIVSGDFYFVEALKNKLYIATVDCTGHGVEGAFVTLIVHSILKLLLTEKEIAQPNEILEQIDFEIRERLNKELSKFNYGLDMSLLRVEDQGDRLEVVFSGAKNDVLLFTNSELNILKSDRKSIGGMINPKKKFTQQSLSVPRDAIFYLFTDGIVDQGNMEGKKIGKEMFIDWLKSIQNLSFAEQKSKLIELNQEFSQNAVQRDDILVFGFRF